MSIFVSLSSSSGLSDITAVSMSSPQRLRSGVSILCSDCAPQPTSYPGTTPGAGSVWELISHAASAAEVEPGINDGVWKALCAALAF